MIAPMNKVFLVLQEAETQAALHALRDLGVVHLELGRARGEAGEEASRGFDLVSKAINILPPNKGAKDSSLKPAQALELAQGVVDAEGRIREIYASLGLLEGEIERCAPWGDFEPQALGDLASQGLFFRFYTAEKRSLESLPADLEYLVVGQGKKAVRIATFAKGQRPVDLRSDFVEFLPPTESLSTLGARKAELKVELEAIKVGFAEKSDYLPSLKAALVWLESNITFETARHSFEGDSGLAAIKGFVPVSDAEALRALAREKAWAILLDEPTADDGTPTKVENGPLVSTIKPVFDFLGIVPAYTEYEISPWFFAFFSLFTAMIFGDAGYGSLMLLLWLPLAIKTWRKGEKLSESLRLFFTIAVLTMTWGAVTGTWFSISAEALPPGLKALTIWPISSANPGASKNVQILCFLIGALQLAVARLKNILRDFPDPKFLAQVGSLALIGGMLFLVLNLVVDPKRFPMPPVALWLVVGGFVANLVFGAYEGNILKSTIEGLKNIIPTFLGAVGVFADIVSYIRLWALGLAGSSLAAIINGMGGGMVKPSLIAVFGVIILVFGHGLNMILSVLSVVVHAIRLNILEFSCNHLGMQWSGRAYEPFKVTYQDKA